MKKIYKTASYEASSEGYALLLDGKIARTPMKNPLVIHHKALAEAIVSEWESQQETIRKETMKLTQIACLAIDLVAHQRKEVLADITPYIDTDLVCYRAGDAAVLEQQQAQAWDPVIVWAEESFGLILYVTGTVMPISQPVANRPILMTLLSTYDDWRLAALTSIVKPLGSILLALALAEGYLDGQTAHRFSYLEEQYETDKWGMDEEKEKKLTESFADILAAEQFLKLIA